VTTLIIANNCTRESGSFMGDQLCAIKAAYLFIENEPLVDRVIMSVSPGNEMHFLWTKFIEKHNVELVYDTFNPGDWPARWQAWDRWRADRSIFGQKFDHYRELYLRIHGAQRQIALCGSERGLGRRNIYEYWFYGQEHSPDTCIGSDWYDDTLVAHSPLTPTRDVYIAPHCKTQGNITFTFDFWSQVVHHLVNNGVTVTVGYNGQFCDDLELHPLYRKHWGDHQAWMDQVCKHKLVACGNTGTGWMAAACGVPLITMEPHNSVMADHRYRECGLRNIVEVVDGYKLDDMFNDMEMVAKYVAKRITEEVRRCTVMTTGCYDVLHAGHVRHLEKSRALGTRLVVALNSDESVRRLKGSTRPINPQAQRKSVLEALRCVDEVQVFDGDNALDLINEIKPQVLTNGFGYAPDKIVGREVVEGWGGRAVVTCTGDATTEPSTTKIVQRVLRSGDVMEICRLGAVYSVNPIDKLKLMAKEFLEVADLSGDVVDLGACRGGTSLIIRRLRPDKYLHIFDTWEGTPIDDPLCHHKRGEWKADLAACRELVGTDGKTSYYSGIFPGSLPGYLTDPDRRTQIKLGFMDEIYCFVYVDMDTYRATRDAIEFFWSRLVQGGKLLLDDYGWEPCAGVKKAVDEVFSDDQRRVVQSQYTCIVEKR
jgi:D-glycero-beta-D-manno-heptose 1-phosphate adenylyltransferase